MNFIKLVIALIIFLAATSSAYAQGIVYSSYRTGIWVGMPGSFAPVEEFSMDLNGDGTTDFRFIGTDPFAGGFYLEPQNRNGVLGYPADAFSSAYRVRRLAAGAGSALRCRPAGSPRTATAR